MTDKCDDCKKPTPLHLLDAVLLDPEGATASEKLYCKACWPKHKKIDGDMWREGVRP